MGNCCLPIRFRRTSSAVNPKNVTLLLLGLDNSGKSTIAKRLAGEPIDSVVPTVGFSVILLRQRGCHVSIYDIGGGPQIRDIWPQYYADAHGVIFVTDAQDVARMEECRQVLEKILQSDRISGKPVLLLANKQDLDGALDEIDVVDRLNLEKLVNEQKCPTLVELCSALNFTKKMDIGIENGYKWLIRSVIRDYPALNNRVLKDLAAQEEQNKVHLIKRPREEGVVNYIEVNPYIDPFKPVKRILEERGHPNGIARTKDHLVVAKIPGLIEEIPEKLKEKKNHVERLLGEEMVSVAENPTSNSTEVFLGRFQSDVELLNEVPNHSFKNFLVRPKSSGARLYGVRSERKGVQRRRALKKSNKTGPSPFTDISNDRNAQMEKSFEGGMKEGVRSPPDINTIENVNPFVVVENRTKDKRKGESREMNVSKSVPNSRRSSVNLGRNRRHSMAKLPGVEKCFPLDSFPSAKEVILDVTKLSD